MDKFLKLLVIVSFPAFSSPLENTDEKLLNAMSLIAAGHYTKAAFIYDSVLINANQLTFSQLVNAESKRLELAYVLEEPKVIEQLTLPLISKLKANKENLLQYNRLVERLCESEDWSKYRELHRDTCQQYESM